MGWLGRTLLLIISAVSMASCSIYPSPEDVLPFESEQIATVVRCQVRDAYRAELVRNLIASKDRPSYRKMSGFEAAQYFLDDPDRFIDVKWSDFNRQLADVFGFYANTVVSYDFSIESSEMNSAGFDLTLLKTFTSGSNSLGFVSKNDRTRKVTRHYRVFDSLGILATKIDNRHCDIPNAPTGPNPLFPSAGILRIHSLVKNFLVENQTGNLGGDKDDYTTGEMADTMVFTTKTSGNFDPVLSANAVPHTYVPSSLKFNIDNYRQDIHTIIILLQIPANTKKLPRFDETGRLVSASEALKGRANAGLDREDAYNTSRSIQQIPTDLRRIVSP